MSKKKQLKKEKKVDKVFDTSYDSEITKLVKILLIVLALFLIFYFVVALIRGDIKFGNDDQKTEEVKIQYEEILGGEIFNSNENEYFVLIYDYTTNEAGLYDILLSNLELSVNSIPVYKVNIANPLNQRYLTDGESTKYPSSAKELLVNGSTLIQIKDKKITLYLEGKDAIKNHLTSITN